MNTIIFQKKEFPVRDIFLKEFGEVTIATTELSKVLLNENGSYISKEAQFVDEGIFFFVTPDEINLPNEIFTTLLETQVI
jgi:hypothetical protein